MFDEAAYHRQQAEAARPMSPPDAFQKYPKIPRLKRGCIITEKIDGTNAQIYFPDDYPDRQMYVGSRKRLITPEDDNFGFARWAYEKEEQLFLELGYGRHYGEWWGQGIQRQYGLDHKRFSIFNTSRFDNEILKLIHVVPVLYKGDFNTTAVTITMNRLLATGSAAAPGFMNPEGVVIYMPQAWSLFKQTFDDTAKG